MIRAVIILNKEQIEFSHFYGNPLEKDVLDSIIQNVKEVLDHRVRKKRVRQRKVDSYFVLFKTMEHTEGLVLIIISETPQDEVFIRKEIIGCEDKFLDFFNYIFSLEDIHRAPKIHMNKISLIGDYETGKSTLAKLISGENAKIEHLLLSSMDIYTVNIEGKECKLWDFTGHARFWIPFKGRILIKASTLVLIITDSTEKNCTESLYISKLIKELEPYIPTIIIANKQDKPEVLSPAQISELFGGLPTYPMVASDPNKREELINIISRHLPKNHNN